MPKSQFIDPKEMRKAGEITFTPISVNQYKKTIKDELKEKNFTKEDLKRIYHDMVVIQVLYTLEPGASQELTLNWGNLEEVGVLAPGTYRIGQSGTLGETPAAVAESFIIQ